MRCQPAIPVEFSDDFMRAADEKSEWQTLSGTWQVQQDKGDRDAAQVNMSANPFRFEATGPLAAEGRAVVGAWFWDDCEITASARPAGAAIGLLAHYSSPNDYVAFRVVLPTPAVAPEARLVACVAGTERTLAAAPVTCAPNQWCRLGLRVSGGYLQGLVDGQIVAQATDAARGTGMVGLLVAGGQALYDDVTVRPWEAMPQPYGALAATDWQTEQGACEVRPGADPVLLVRGKPNARVLSPWSGLQAYQCWAAVRPATAAESGIFVRYRGPRDYYLVSLEPAAGSKVHVFLKRTARGDDATLGQALVDGGPATEHTVFVDTADEHLRVWIDGKPQFDVTDEGPRSGRFGPYVRGEGTAAFRALGALPGDREQRVVDEITPSFAGIIDRHTWAGRANSLAADPTDLAAVWHRGEFVGDCAAAVGVRQEVGHPQTVVSLLLGDASGPASGYELRATRLWDQAPMKLEALRKGQRVAESTLELSATRSSFEAAMARVNGSLVLRIDGEAALTWRDPQPLDARRIGMKLTGSSINPDDTRIETPNVRVYTFGQAATDWRTERGTWEVASRWSCSPGWTWFAGWDKQAAWTLNKEVVTGDQRMEMYVGAKMVDVEGQKGKQEVLRDIRMALCATPGDITSGYRFTLGGRGNLWTAIEKNGKVLAERNWSVPQTGLHNDWGLATAVKRGKVVSLLWEGQELLRVEDPEPLQQGHVAMGTFDNGLLIPKVSIYGQVVRPAAPLMLAAGVAAVTPPVTPPIAKPAGTAKPAAEKPAAK